MFNVCTLYADGNPPQVSTFDHAVFNEEEVSEASTHRLAGYRFDWPVDALTGRLML
jgi:hypothetical protein